MKAKNCTGKRLELGMVVCLEQDNRNRLQRLLGIKRKIVEIANPSSLSGLTTVNFNVTEKLYLDKNGELIDSNSKYFECEKPAPEIGKCHSLKKPIIVFAFKPGSELDKLQKEADKYGGEKARIELKSKLQDKEYMESHIGDIIILNK